MSNDLDQRLRNALGDAAARIARDDAIPPGLALPTKTHVRWPLIAVAAAAAVSLVVAIPYALRQPDREPTPAKAPVTEAPEDPPPLDRVAGRLPRPRHILGIYEPNETNGLGRAVLVGASGAGQDVPGGRKYGGFTNSLDQNTYYLSWNDNDADCTGRVFKVTVDDQGKPTSRVEVNGAARKGVLYSNQSLSPDGKRLALVAEAAAFNGKDCDLARADGHSLSTVDLATNERRDWSADLDHDRLYIADNGLTWSFDNKYVVFQWPPNDDLTVPQPKPTGESAAPKATKPLRMLDPSLPPGDLISRSRVIPDDPNVGDLDLLTPVNTIDEHALAVGAYADKGGARVLASAVNKADPSLTLFELRLGSGKLTLLADNWTP